MGCSVSRSRRCGRRMRSVRSRRPVWGTPLHAHHAVLPPHLLRSLMWRDCAVDFMRAQLRLNKSHWEHLAGGGSPESERSATEQVWQLSGAVATPGGASDGDRVDLFQAEAEVLQLIAEDPGLIILLCCQPDLLGHSGLLPPSQPCPQGTARRSWSGRWS